MILRSIELEGWRCFASTVQLGPFGDGLNIIHGPNGVGKSSLMMALARGLFDNHNVGGTSIRSLRPWGRELTPKVTIEFDQCDERYRLHKQFLDAAFSKLERDEAGQFTPIAENRAADERAREILAGKASSRGASDRRHWGLAQILWASQGNLEIDALGPGTKATIQNALGKQIAGTGTDALQQRISERFRHFFTASGKLRMGASAPAIVGLSQQREKELARQENLQGRLSEFEAASRSVEELRVAADSARKREHALNVDLDETRKKCQTYEVLTQQQQKLRIQVRSQEEKHAALNRQIKSIDKMTQERATIEKHLESRRADLPDLKNAFKQVSDQLLKADEDVKTARGRRRKISAIRKLAESAEQFARVRKLSAELQTRIEHVEFAQTEIKRLEEERAQLVAPDKKTLRQITRLARQRDDARLKLDASLITIRMQLELDAKIEITQGESPGKKNIKKSNELEIKGAPDVAIEIPGVGTFHATGPAGDFAEFQKQWQDASNQFDQLAEPFDTKDVVEIESLRLIADELDQKIQAANIKFDTLLTDQTLPGLRSQLADAQDQLAHWLTEHPDWSESPLDPVFVRGQADEIESKISGEIEKAEQVLDQLTEQQLCAQRAIDRFETNISESESRINALGQSLAAVEGYELDAQQRANQLAEIAMQRDAAKGQLAKVETEIESLGQDPNQKLINLESKQRSFREQASQAERNLHTESGRLEQIISEAPYSALVDAEEEIARLDAEIERHQLQVDAIQLLQDTVVQQKSEVMQSLIDPIRLRARNILQRIGANRFEGVQFGEDLLPTGIAPNSLNESVSLDQISGGEQEQVHFAVRMALADVVFPNGRQLVVLDDVFTFTDASRLNQIVGLLDEFSESFQIVLLTCHPERYRDITSARFFDLENITANCVH